MCQRVCLQKFFFSPHSTSELATVMVQWQTPYHLQVSSQIAQSVITASSLYSSAAQVSILGQAANLLTVKQLISMRKAQSMVQSTVQSIVHSPGFVVSQATLHKTILYVMHFPIVWCVVYIHFAACSLTTNLQSTIPLWYRLITRPLLPCSLGKGSATPD